MKYVHGTDEKLHDQFMIWGIRFVFLIVLLAFLFLLWLFCFLFYGAIKGYLDATIGMFLLFVGIPCLAATLFGLYECYWTNARYSLDENGITMVFLFHSRRYSWTAFQKICVSPLCRGVRDPKTHDYIILMMSDCEDLVSRMAVPNCWKYQKRFLIVRKTDARLSEFRKYCTITAC